MTALLRRKIGPIPMADAVIAALICLAAFATTYWAADWRPEQYIWCARDVWFDADTDRVVRIEAQTSKDYGRTMMHPLYPFITAPPIKLIETAGASANFAVRFVHSWLAGLWVSLFFLLLRRFLIRRFDALVFAGVAASSTAAIFWLPSFETFVLGSISMFPVLALVAGPTPGTLLQQIGAGVFAFGITITNFMAALFSWIATLPKRRTAALTAASVAIIVSVAIAHKYVFRGSVVMLEAPGEECAWILSPESGGPLAVMRVFFFSSVVAPEIRFETNWLRNLLPWMTMQFGGLCSGSAWSWIATPAWALLLAAGVYALRTLRTASRLPVVLTTVILYQLLLHILYGRETFLYAPHYVPLLVAVAALATRTPLRKAVLALAGILIVANLFNNVPTFRWCKAYTTRNLYMNELQAKGIIHPVALDKDPSWNYKFWKDLKFSWPTKN